MTGARQAGIVVDTMVMSWIVEPERSPLPEPYEQLIVGRPILVPFHTVMELRFGALNAPVGASSAAFGWSGTCPAGRKAERP